MTPWQVSCKTSRNSKASSHLCSLHVSASGWKVSRVLSLPTNSVAGGSSSEPWTWGLRPVTSTLPVFSEDDLLLGFPCRILSDGEWGWVDTQDDLLGTVTHCRLLGT